MFFALEYYMDWDDNEEELLRVLNAIGYLYDIETFVFILQNYSDEVDYKCIKFSNSYE